MDKQPKSTSRELRERFSDPKPQTQQFIDVKDILGIAAEEMKDVIASDISAMLNKDYIKSMEGYIFCLSRIINHDVAWECITRAFAENSESVPKKYYNQFGRHLKTEK